MGAIDEVQQLALEQLTHAHVLGAGAGQLQLSLQGVVEQTTELLRVLLDAGVLLRPPEGFHQLLCRHWLLLVVQFVE